MKKSRIYVWLNSHKLTVNHSTGVTVSMFHDYANCIILIKLFPIFFSLALPTHPDSSPSISLGQRQGVVRTSCSAENVSTTYFDLKPFTHDNATSHMMCNMICVLLYQQRHFYQHHFSEPLNFQSYPAVSPLAVKKRTHRAGARKLKI